MPRDMHAEYYQRRRLRKRYDRVRKAEWTVICLIASLSGATIAFWLGWTFQ